MTAKPDCDTDRLKVIDEGNNRESDRTKSNHQQWLGAEFPNEPQAGPKDCCNDGDSATADRGLGVAGTLVWPVNDLIAEQESVNCVAEEPGASGRQKEEGQS